MQVNVNKADRMATIVFAFLAVATVTGMTAVAKPQNVEVATAQTMIGGIRG